MARRRSTTTLASVAASFVALNFCLCSNNFVDSASDPGGTIAESAVDGVLTLAAETCCSTSAAADRTSWSLEGTTFGESPFGVALTSKIARNFEVKRIASGHASSAAPPIETAPGPPAGWEMPPTLHSNTKAGKKSSSPACCEFDKLCCTRQAEIDSGIRRLVTHTFDVRFADVPEPVIKETSKDGSPIEGAAPVRVVDGTGAPFPWHDGPKQFEIRIIPQAALGFLRFGKGFSGTHFEKPQYRSLGYGVTAPITETPDRGRSLVQGPIEYWTYNRGEQGTIIHDHVKGKLAGSPNIIAERWVHATAIDAASGIVHTYRATYEDKPYVFFILPEAVIGFESKDTLTFGGTGNDRFATDFPYTLYRFPLGPGRSNTINCILHEYEVRRWFDRPKDAVKLPEDLLIAISMSQTSVETEPRIRIMFL